MEAPDSPNDGVGKDIKSKKKADKLLARKKEKKTDTIVVKKQILLKYVNKLLESIDNTIPFDDLLKFDKMNMTN